MFVLFPVHVAVLPVSRRPRVPGTSTDVYRRDVACGADPTSALVRALDNLPVHAGHVWSVGVGHDDECPSLVGGGMDACTCELVRVEARRAA
jgi:hypothetical protein